jgi:hypothetical protein
MNRKDPAEIAIRDIRRMTQRYYSPEGPHGEESIATWCRREALRRARITVASGS